MAGTASTGQTTGNTAPLLRVAASTRPFLLGWRWYFGPALIVQALKMAGVFDAPAPGALLLLLVPVYWLLNRSHAVWIEEEDAIVRVRSRGVGDFAARMPQRSSRRGDVRSEYPRNTRVRYDDTGAWWRADRGLFVGDDRYAIYPEGRKLAQVLADRDRTR